MGREVLHGLCFRPVHCRLLYLGGGGGRGRKNNLQRVEYKSTFIDHFYFVKYLLHVVRCKRVEGGSKM